MNKRREGNSLIPNPRIVVDYNTSKIAFYPHCVGAFSYYSRSCLENAGLIDEEYYNACEHVDHTYSIIKTDMHPPFWWFADIDESWKYLGDEEWSISKSTISSNPNHSDMMRIADGIFVRKHDMYPCEIPDSSIDYVKSTIKKLKRDSYNT
jgi:hypothetical protein